MRRVFLFVVLLLLGCEQDIRVPVYADQRQAIHRLREQNTDEEIAKWSGDRLLREMKASK